MPGCGVGRWRADARCWVSRAGAWLDGRGGRPHACRTICGCTMVAVHPLAHKVLDYIRQLQLLTAGDRVGLAVSGGSDSGALLGIFLELRAELGIVLSVVHFNHKLRGGESDQDETFVSELARSNDLEFHCESADVSALAIEKRQSLETVARELRYEFFRKLLQPAPHGNANPTSRLDKIATGHTLDDQAETVVMRVLRGTGMRGLGGIYPAVELQDEYDEALGQVIDRKSVV